MIYITPVSHRRVAAPRLFLAPEAPLCYRSAMNFVIFLVALGAALRLTRLAVADTITQTFRTRLSLRYAAASALESQSDHNLRDDRGVIAAADVKIVRRFRRRVNAWLWLVQLFECPWCIGFWISGLAAAAAISVSPAGSPLQQIPLWFVFPGLTLTLSYLVGVIYTAVFTLEEFYPGGHDH